MKRIGDTDRGTEAFHKALTEHEDKLVWDVTVCAESPCFPSNLRTRLHRIVIDHAIECRPANADTHPTVETIDDALRELAEMSFKLHSLFHDLSRIAIMSDDGASLFSDNPLSPIRVLFSRGDEFREQLVETDKTKTRSSS